MEPDETDIGWMRLALEAAAKGRGMVEPNPMVGAVVVREGRLEAVGRHARFGGPHAEIDALTAAGEQARGATLYVTLEPCCHHGKTPPCIDAILRAGVSRVVAAHRDPFPRVDGGGLARLREAGLTVTVGVEADAAVALNAPYLKRVLTGRPYVVAKWAMTLDGKTAVASGDSRWISSAGSRAFVHATRGRMDAVVVGIGTAIADDPQLTARPAGPRTPTRIVLDGEARLPLTSVLARTARETPTLVAVTDRAPGDRRAKLQAIGVEVLGFEGSPRVPIGPLLDELGSRGMTNILIEGGGEAMGAFLDAGEVDEVDAFIAPVLEGGDHPRTPIRGAGRSLMSEAARLDRVVHSTIEGDLRVQGQLRQPWRARLIPLVGGRRGNPA